MSMQQSPPPIPLDIRLMNRVAALLCLAWGLGLLAAGAWWLLRQPGFAIARIVVQGETVHTNALTLRAHLAPHLQGNFFTLDLQAARALLEQMPWVRRAQLRRVYPGRLLVWLQEHRAAAYWGPPETGSTLVNREGELFEANPADVEAEGLPRLLGPASAAADVLRMYRQLAPLFAPLALQQLELSARGGWRATLDNAAVLELGGGPPGEVLERTQRFVHTLARAAQQYGRGTQALEFADLRHSGGYALRLRGVATVDSAQQAGAPTAPAAGAAGGAQQRNRSRRAPAPPPALRSSGASRN